jgi:competence protein ComEC
MIELSNSFQKFWLLHPALFYGLSSLIGIWSILQPSWLVLLALLFLWIPLTFNHYKKLLLSAILMIFIILYGSIHYQIPDLPTEGIMGQAHVQIDHLSLKDTYFGKQWQYQCHLVKFIPVNESNSIARHLPCQIHLSPKSIFYRPPANQAYLIKGVLKKIHEGQYILKIHKQDSWLPVQDSWSLAEWRFQYKTTLSYWIKQHFPDRKTGTFLAGLITGDFDDHLMQDQFGRFGLLHIMAISGFHFSILAAFLGCIFRLIFSTKKNALFLIAILTAYTIFLGPQASILRAWIMIAVTLLGQCLEKQGQALNSLGLALMIILGIDPWLSQTIGFQFSFLTTAAILLGYTSVDLSLTQLLPKRPLSQMIEMNRWNQHGYCLLVFFRQGIALSLSVNAFALPLTLYYYHQFPWMGLIYNLFFPVLVSFAMGLLLLGFLFPFSLIHSVNHTYTQWILSLTYDMPKAVDTYYQIEHLPGWVLIPYFCLLFTSLIVLKQLFIEQRKTKEDWLFL